MYLLMDEWKCVLISTKAQYQCYASENNIALKMLLKQALGCPEATRPYKAE